jgi:monoamine oxidase
MSISRREFVGSAAALTVAAGAARADASADVDVAIIGAGAAGTYTAWRLRQERPELHVRLFEASNRIGGRLRSVAFPQAPHLVAELGGMRFLDAHRHVSGLVGKLDLKTRDYPIDRDVNRVMLRGRNFSQSDVHSGHARFPYRIPDADQMPGAAFFDRAIAKVLPNAAHMSPADWRRVRAAYRFKGKLLKDWSNRELLIEGMSADELAFTEDASGYDDWIEGETGLDELDYYFVHDDEDKPFKTLADGYQQLPLTLAHDAAKAGTGLAMGERLVSLRQTSTGFRLGLQDRNNRLTILSAARVVLALPRMALEAIADFPDARHPRFASLIASVTPIPACKSLLLYERPWWRDHGIVEGRSITDMPARQFYCLGSEVTRPSSEPNSGFGVLMAYCDEKSVATWNALVAAPDSSGFSVLPGNSPLAAEVHREAKLVIGDTPLKPLAARFQNWGVDPYGGGWHYYALGHDGVADGEAIVQPLPGRNLFVCGEAYSFAQGWVEGALERAETVLQRHFGLKPPAWLKA